jgi:hypothetical protein
MAKPTLPQLDEGWTYADIARADAEQGKAYRGKDGDTVLFSIKGPVWLPIPATMKAAKDAVEDYRTKLVTHEGTRTLTGITGMCVKRGYLHAAESLRGEFRDLARAGRFDEDAVRNRILGYRYGQKRSRSVEVSREALLACETDEERLALLAASGVNIG